MKNREKVKKKADKSAYAFEGTLWPFEGQKKKPRDSRT